MRPLYQTTQTESIPPAQCSHVHPSGCSHTIPTVREFIDGLTRAYLFTAIDESIARARQRNRQR